MIDEEKLKELKAGGCIEETIDGEEVLICGMSKKNIHQKEEI